jgi:glycosyltransferase involved in cell wall biosynthesis
MRRMIKRALVPRLLRASSGALVCGSLGRDFFLRYGESEKRIHFFPLEPDYDLIESVTPEQVQAARAEWGLDPRRRRIVYSGRFIDLKRVDLLIDAFCAIANDRPEWDLVLAGDGPLRQELEARVPETLRSRVKWLGFFADQQQLNAVYHACDVLALCSDFDQWALVIVEAAAAGLGIVASDVVGAAAELVRDGVNGRIFPKGDVESLKASLRDVTDLSKIDSMKSQSRLISREWREKADPIEGLRKALRENDVL